MKKSFYVFAMAAVICGFMACGNSKAPEAQQTGEESVEVVTVEDSDAEDTSEVTTRGGSESEGFGRCWESGCHCKAFKGRGDTCENCGHA